MAHSDEYVMMGAYDGSIAVHRHTVCHILIRTAAYGQLGRKGDSIRGTYISNNITWLSVQSSIQLQ